MKIVVLSGEIPIYEVSAALLDDGIVVLAGITAAQAYEIEKKIIEALEIDKESEDSPILNHLSTEVPNNNGWFHFLVYSEKHLYQQGPSEQKVVKAALGWERAGEPNKFITLV